MVAGGEAIINSPEKRLSASRARKHRGSIRQRGKSSFEIRVFVGIDSETGKRCYLTRTVRGTQRDAEVELTKLLRQVDEGAIAPQSGSVGELVEAWYRLRLPTLSPPVAHNYRLIINRHILPRWGSTTVRQIRVKDIDNWYARLFSSGGVGGRSLSANSVRRIHSILHAALAQGVRWGQLSANPADSATPPPVHRQTTVLEARLDDLVKLVDSSGKVNRALPIFFRLAIASGARRGELCALRWRDLDLQLGIVRIGRSIVEAGGVLTEKDTKTHQIRGVSIDPTTRELLRDYRTELEILLSDSGSRLSEGSFVFSHDPKGGSPWRPGYVTSAFCRLRNELGHANLRLHDLRHASASLLIANGIDIKTVSARLGHAQTSTTLDIYAHLIAHSDDRASKTIGILLDGHS